MAAIRPTDRARPRSGPEPRPRPRPPLSKRERTCSELVAAAERLVAARGLDAISIDEITQAAAVAKGTFYTHFEDKLDLATVLGRRIRVELEEKITAQNAAVTNAAARMAGGLSTMLAFAIVQPIRARALLRVVPDIVDPGASINAGVRGDLALGLKQGRFVVASLDTAVVTTIGIVLAAGMRLSDAERPVADGFAFAGEVVATALIALGVRRLEAERLARAALEARKKELAS